MIDKNWVIELEHLMEQLRGKNGCPWDLKQTHDSLKKYLIEEAYEFLEAIDEKNDSLMQSELGDLLLQIVFHCQIAKEEGRFNIQDCAKKCCEMLVRRHPHVFGDTKVHDAEGVVKQWEEIKAKEAHHEKRTSALDGIPKGLPALMHAEKMQEKAAKVGFDWDTIEGPLDKIQEELLEIREALSQQDKEATREEVGDLLFSVVNLVRFCGGDAEELMRHASAKFNHRFRKMEANQPNLKGLSQELLEQLWQKSKT